MIDPIRVPIEDRSQVGEARRQALALAAAVGIGAAPQDRLALIVTELGTNLIKHANGGQLIVRALAGGGGLEVLALDSGAGMTRVEDCLRDGYSSAGSAGTGLGAIHRLSSLVDIYSVRSGGTAVVARIAGDERSGAAPAAMEIGAVCLPKAGQDVCGDAWSGAAGTDASYSVLVADGLGHGLGAADASQAARRLFEARPDLAPGQQVAALHEGLRGTRGAAVAVARVNHRAGTLVFAGVGNVAGAVVAAGVARQLVSLNGTAGHVVQRINEFTYPWVEDALLVMHTDGLGSRWSLDRYPGLDRRHPSVIAGVLFRDFARQTDDATVVVARCRRS